MRNLVKALAGCRFRSVIATIALALFVIEAYGSDERFCSSSSGCGARGETPSPIATLLEEGLGEEAETLKSPTGEGRGEALPHSLSSSSEPEEGDRRIATVEESDRIASDLSSARTSTCSASAHISGLGKEPMGIEKCGAHAEGMSWGIATDSSTVPEARSPFPNLGKEPIQLDSSSEPEEGDRRIATVEESGGISKGGDRDASLALASKKHRGEYRAIATPRHSEISHAVSNVSLFTDRAVLTRTGTAHLKKGRNEIVFAGIRDNADLRSIRAGNIVPEGAQVLGVSWERCLSTTLNSERIAELEKKLGELERQAFIVGNELAEADKLLQKAGDFSKLFADSANANTSAATDLGTASESLRAELLRTSERKFVLEEKLQKIKREIEPVRAELSAIYGGGNARSSLNLVLSLMADKDADGEVSVAYTTRAAGWEPSYEIRLLDGAEAAEFSFNGQVWQNTGEDWKGVKLTLSTAQPQISATPPKAKTVALSGHKLENPDDRQIVEEVQSAGAESKPMPLALTADGVAAVNDLSEVREQGIAVSFDVAGTHDIPSAGGRRQQVSLAKEKLAVKAVSLEAAPRLRGGVYSRVELKNDAVRPLPAGALSICKDTGFEGNAHLRYVPAGAEFAVFGGVESGLSASCETLPEFSTKKGKVFGENATYEGDIYKIANLTDTPRKVRVRSQIKVSEIDDVKISILEKAEQHIPATTPGYVLEKETGFIYWDVDVPANGEVTLTLSTKTVKN